MKTSVVGLGKLGSPLAAVLAHQGHDVIGVDRSATVVEMLRAGRAPVQEPGLQAMLAESGPRLRFTTDVEVAVHGSEISFVIVPTPSDASGWFSLDALLPAVDAVGRAARAATHRHVVVITSTVMPGSTAGPIAEALEYASGLVVGDSIGLCYSPEFIALGSVVHDLLHPDFVLVGESDSASGDRLADTMSTVAVTGPPVMRMSLLNAELAKIAVNTYVTTKISYANMLAEMCEQLPGGDVDVVTRAIGLDSRIGAKYLRGATGYGGPCFPRDNVAFAALARSVGVSADIAEATHNVNRRQASRLAARVLAECEPGAGVCVLGLSYKPGTSVVEESVGVALARLLVDRNLRVTAYDPAANEGARRDLPSEVDVASSVAEALVGATVAVVVTPWDAFARLDVGDLAGCRVVVDCWRILPASVAEKVHVIHIGVGPEEGP